MLPIVELRGAIPLGVSLGVGIVPTYIAAVLGNCLPVPFLIIFAGKILTLISDWPVVGKLAKKIIQIGNSKIGAMHPSLFWALFLFVAVPLPGTGAWTGCLIATLLRLPLKKSLLPICAGVAVAGVVVSLAAYGLVQLFGVFL